MLQHNVSRRLLVVAVTGVIGVNAVRAADTASGALDEIVVTAQKTSEPMSKVPISISAVSGPALAEQHIVDYADLSRAVPNLSFSSFGGPGQSNIEIRGVSSQAGSATTGIYLDDVPINILNIYTAGATEPRFLDIDRVEVLRGPQGTLYGASSMGGTIHFVSNQPNLREYAGSVHASAGGTERGGLNYEADSTLNVPLVEGQAALRMSALYEHESGWIDRVHPTGRIVDRRINDANTSVVRATLKWQPTEALSITPSVFLQRVSTGGQSLSGLALPPFQSPTLLAESGRDEYAIASLTVNYDLGWSDLTSVSGYFWRSDNRLIDGTYYDSVYIGQSLLAQQPANAAGAAAISGLAAPAQFDTNVNQVHQELRLASKPAGPGEHWSWLAGLYYSRSRTGLLDDEHIPGFSATMESYYGAAADSLLGATLPFPNDLIYYAFSEFVNTQEAAFGQVTYHVTPALKVTAGGRYQKSRETLSFTSDGYFAGGTPPFAGAADGTAFTPKASLAYEVTAGTMLYASAAEGFRDGGVNRPVPVPLCSADLANLGLAQAPAAYKSDKLWSYELGAKSRPLGGSLSLSAAVFDIRWNNIQTDIILPTCTFDIKDNIGSAESKGVEVELGEHLSERINVTLGGNYTSAKIVVPVTLLGVQKGDRVPGVPDWSVSAAIEYSQPLASGAHGTGRLNAQWVGPSQGTIYHGDPDFDRPGYFVMGGSAGLRFGSYDLSLFVTNLLNEHKSIQRPNIAAVEYSVTVRPRTYGIGGTYSF